MSSDDPPPAGRSLIRRIVGPRPLRRASFLVAAVVLALLVDAAAMWFRIDRFDGAVTGSAAGGTTYLLIGSDSRAFVTSEEDRARYGGADATPGERADVVIAIRVDRDGSARMLLVSRDLLVSSPKGGLIRLAETMQRDGPKGTVASLCRSIGLGVDHVVVVHLNGLRGVVDAVDGVDLTLASPIRDRDSGLRLPGGRVRLSGDDVLAYVGSRHLEHQRPDGSWYRKKTDSADRPGRAAQLLEIVARRADPSPRHPVRAQRVLWAASGGLAMDDTMGLTESLTLADRLRGLSGAPTLQLPVTSSGGFLPVDEVAAGSAQVLDRFDGGGRRRSCDRPTFPITRRS